LPFSATEESFIECQRVLEGRWQRKRIYQWCCCRFEHKWGLYFVLF